MANVRSGNVFKVDSIGVLNAIGTRVMYVVVTATTSNAAVTLQDAITNASMLDLRHHQANSSVVYDFSRNPIFFPNGIEVGAITNAVVTIVYNERGG